MIETLIFFAGLFIGAIGGFFIFALVAVAAQADRDRAHLDD